MESLIKKIKGERKIKNEKKFYLFGLCFGNGKDTNALLDKPSNDELLFKKNKWLICHEKNNDLIEKGVFPGIKGENYKIQF